MISLQDMTSLIEFIDNYKNQILEYLNLQTGDVKATNTQQFFQSKYVPKMDNINQDDFLKSERDESEQASFFILPNGLSVIKGTNPH